MHTEHSSGQRDRRPRKPFRRRNRHPGLAEREIRPTQVPKPKGEIPEAFAGTVFGLVHPLLQHAVADEAYLTPTPIQEKAIPYLLEGRDLMGCAQTGTGKTAAFLLPILHRLTLNPKPAERNRPRALVLAPTRELAAQIATSTATYGRYLGLPFAVVFGGVSQYPQVSALNRGAALVVATPGRLLDLYEQGHLALDAIEEFVLDEADRMLDMGFMPDIKRILAMLPAERHTQFFSATFSPEITRLAMSMVKDPVQITISPDQPTVDRINQTLMFVDKPNKDALLGEILANRPEMGKVLVFARTRHGADKIERKLCQAQIPARAIHSDKTQRARMDALNAFRSGRVRVLVATDIASRGIDVDGITHVVNFDLPEETESYVHRIGRTARAGAAGAALSFVSAEERGLLRAIERMIRKSIEVDNTHTYHSERAEKAGGKGGPDSLSRPAWAARNRTQGGAKGGGAHPRDRMPSRSSQGRRQPDFRRGPRAEPVPPGAPERPARAAHSHERPDGGAERRDRRSAEERIPSAGPASPRPAHGGDTAKKDHGGPPHGGSKGFKPRFRKGGKPKHRPARPPWMT